MLIPGAAPVKAYKSRAFSSLISKPLVQLVEIWCKLCTSSCRQRPINPSIGLADEVVPRCTCPAARLRAAPGRAAAPPGSPWPPACFGSTRTMRGITQVRSIREANEVFKQFTVSLGAAFSSQLACQENLSSGCRWLQHHPHDASGVVQVALLPQVHERCPRRGDQRTLRQ